MNSTYDKYQFKARTLERKFKRKMTKYPVFYTATGKVNTVTEYSAKSFSFKTERNRAGLTISIKGLRQAITYLYFKRTAIRKDLEPFSNYSSALFGVLQEIFSSISKMQRSANGLLRLTLQSVRFYFSGLCRSPGDMKLISQEGGEFVILSYYHLRSQKSEVFLKYLKKYNLKAMIDSGAYSVYQALENKKKVKESQLSLFDDTNIPPISIDEYAAFINRHKESPYIVGFINLDVIGDPTKTKENYKELVKRTNIEIIPVWQVTDSYDELQRLVDESPSLICIGGCVPLLKTNQKEKVESILEKVFTICKEVPLHGLGIANELIHKYPFFSSDSIAWANARKNGTRKLYTEVGQKINADDYMSLYEVLVQNIRYFAELEFLYERSQLPLFHIDNK